jgi:hypothetical protein
LEKAGYSEGDLVGIELDKEETDDGYVMPYLDLGGRCLEDQGSYFEVVSYSTSWKADSINGVMKPSRACGRCEEAMVEEEAIYTEQEGDVCPSCFEDNYVYFEDSSYRIRDCTRVSGGELDGWYVPDILLSDNNYHEPVDSSNYYYIDELTSYDGDFYLTENCVELAEETCEGDSYAPTSKCTELEESELDGLGDWEDTWKLGWYTDEHYADIMEEVKRLLELQEARQTDLEDLMEELV